MFGDILLMKKKKLLKRLFILLIAIYVIFTLINQQKTLNQYSKNSEELNTQIAEAEEEKEELTRQKDNVDSLEFIEKTARDMLDMYYPNERVYINQGI